MKNLILSVLFLLTGLSVFAQDLFIKKITISGAVESHQMVKISDENIGNIKGDTVKIDVLKLNDIVADSIIPASSFTGNLGNSTTGADTIFSDVVISGLYNYAADTGSTDAYKIPIPSITAYITGLKITFLTVTANTDAATVTINGLAAKTLKKLRDQDVVTGDIEASQIIDAVYDGTNFQIVSQLAQ